MAEPINLLDAKVDGEKALYVKLVDDIEPGSIATTAIYEKAIVSLDLDAEGNILGITIEW